MKLISFIIILFSISFAIADFGTCNFHKSQLQSDHKFNNCKSPGASEILLNVDGINMCYMIFKNRRDIFFLFFTIFSMQFTNNSCFSCNSVDSGCEAKVINLVVSQEFLESFPERNVANKTTI